MNQNNAEIDQTNEFTCLIGRRGITFSERRQRPFGRGSNGRCVCWTFFVLLLLVALLVPVQLMVPGPAARGSQSATGQAPAAPTTAAPTPVTSNIVSTTLFPTISHIDPSTTLGPVPLVDDVSPTQKPTFALASSSTPSSSASSAASNLSFSEQQQQEQTQKNQLDDTLKTCPKSPIYPHQGGCPIDCIGWRQEHGIETPIHVANNSEMERFIFTSRRVDVRFFIPFFDDVRAVHQAIQINIPEYDLNAYNSFSTNNAWGAHGEKEVHMTILYGCCYTKEEIQKAREALADFQYHCLEAYFGTVSCHRYDKDHISFILEVLLESQGRLQELATKLESRLRSQGVPVPVARASNLPFHFTLFIAPIGFPAGKAISIIQDLNFTNNDYFNTRDTNDWADGLPMRFYGLQFSPKNTTTKGFYVNSVEYEEAGVWITASGKDADLVNCSSGP